MASCGTVAGNGCGNTGSIKSDYSIADAGSYKVRFGVTNFGDQLVDSGLAYAGVTVGGNPIPVGGTPEPGTWALFISGFGLVGTALRRRTGRVIAIKQPKSRSVEEPLSIETGRHDRVSFARFAEPTSTNRCAQIFLQH